MKSVRGNVPLGQITRHGDNYLDIPFKVGDRVALTEKGVEHYGWNKEFELGRRATIVGIPTERWNSNCVTAKWDDAREPIETPHETTEGRAFTVGCWSFDWVPEVAAHQTEVEG